MADRMLPFGQVTPTARPIGAFVQAAQQDTPGPARPVELPAARGIDTLQQSGTTNVQGFNQFQQLAAALAPFSSALMKTAETGYESYAKGKIEEGYYRARNQYARAQLSLQVQAETGAADAASTIGQLQKRDPEAAQLLKESNPWALIGQRRAVAQLVAADVENALEDDLVNSAGLLAQMKPGSPALKARQVQLTSQALGRYGLTGDELEVNFYVTPRVNKASEQYTDKQRKFYNKAVEDSTTSAATAALGATVDQILKNDAVVDGVTYKRGTAEWREYGAAVLTQGLDQQLRLLDPEARARAIQYIRAQVGGTYGNAGPFAAGLLQSIRGGDPSMPYEKRPTWGAMAPLEMQELQVRGMKATQEQHDLKQKTVENQLNTAWYGTPEKKGPGSLDPNDPGYPAALVAFRNMALGMGYLNPEEYIARRANDQSRYVQVVSPPDPFLAENFAVEIGMMPPSAWTDDPNAYANALRQAQQIANQEPTPEGKRETYRRLVGEIDKARSSAADFDAGVRDRVQQEVLQDLDSDAVRQIRDKQKVGGKQGPLLSQMMASQIGSGVSVSAAVASTYQNAQLTAAANRLTALYERELSTGIRNWKAENPGRQLSPAQRSVEMSEAAARARKSPQYVQIIKELTGRQPGELGPRKVGTNPKDARGVPREGARKLSDDTIRTYQSRPVMEPRWVYGELQQLQRGKPVSPELYNMARRANTTTFNYLLEQLKMYPTLDPKGEAKRWLEEKIRQQRPARTVAGNQVSSVVRDGLGGWNPLAAGGWLMSMIAPPAAAATLPPSFSMVLPPGGVASSGDLAGLGRGMGGLLGLIRSGEGGWNSVNRGVAGDTPGGIGTLTTRAIGSLVDLQERGRVFAVGAYQFTPGVLARAMREAGLSRNAPFTPENQNRMAVALITGSKRPALAAYIRGESNNLNAAHTEIAQEWAALQGPSGRGMYDNDKAGNKASVSSQKVRALLQQARQEYIGRNRGRRASATPNTELGNQLVAQLAEEGGYEDVAGLQPLPINRMLRQAGRPMSPASRGQDAPWYGTRKGMKVDPSLHDQTIQRNQRNQQAIENWDPIEAESKQRLNNTNPSPRSRASAPSQVKAVEFLYELERKVERRKRDAFDEAGKDDPRSRMSGPVYKEFANETAKMSKAADNTLFLTPKERAAVRSMTFQVLDAAAKGRDELGKEDLPVSLNRAFPKLGNDLLYEWNMRRLRLRENTVDMLQMGRDAIRPIDLPGQ
jgi:hypothetical protein